MGFHWSPTRAPGLFNHFLRSSALSTQRATKADPLLTFLASTLTHPSPSPPSSEGRILAPRALSPKCTSLHLPCASGLAVYIGLYYQPAFALAFLSIVAL
jgi:hypothetical protein